MKNLESLTEGETNKLIGSEMHDFLKSKGYTIKGNLSNKETKTSENLLAVYNEEMFMRVLKIPRKKLDETSIATINNMTKGYGNENELQNSSRLKHNNIASFIDYLIFKDQYILISDYEDGESLRTIVGEEKQLDAKELRHVFGGAGKGLGYMHLVGYLHRDIKPSNILANLGNEISKVIDLQNSKLIGEIEKSSLSTRGGAKFTAPEILNSWAKGTPEQSSVFTDFYSLYATLAFAATNEQINYGIEINGEGREIKIGDKTYKIKLTLNGEPIDEITKEMHNKEVERITKNAPRKLRKMLRHGLEFTTVRTDYKSEQFLSQLEKATDTIPQRIKKAIPSALKFTGGLLVGGAIIGGFFLADMLRVPAPELKTLLNMDEYNTWTSIDSNPKLKMETFDEIDYLFDELKEDIQELYKDDNKFDFSMEDIDDYAEWGEDRIGIDKRLSKSILIAGVATKPEEVYHTYNKERSWPSWKPGNFYEHMPVTPHAYINNYSAGKPKTKVKLKEDIQDALHYLKLILKDADTPGEAIANYFIPETDRKAASHTNNEPEYFPSINPEDSTEILGGYAFSSNFIYVMNGLHKTMVNRAMLAYMAMDKDGNIDLNKLENIPTQSDTVKYGPMPHEKIIHKDKKEPLILIK